MRPWYMNPRTVCRVMDRIATGLSITTPLPVLRDKMDYVLDSIQNKQRHLMGQ